MRICRLVGEWLINRKVNRAVPSATNLLGAQEIGLQVSDEIDGEVSGGLADDHGWVAESTIEKAEKEVAELPEEEVELFTEWCIPSKLGPGA